MAKKEDIFDKAKDALNKAADVIKDTAEDIVENVQEMVEDVKDFIEDDKTQQVVASVKDAGEKIAESAKEGASKVSETIKATAQKVVADETNESKTITRKDAKIPEGPLAEKWSNYKAHQKLVNPANKRRLDIIVVGTGLAGASAAASLAELGFNVLNFCIQDSPRRAHSIAAQRGYQCDTERR